MHYIATDFVKYFIYIFKMPLFPKSFDLWYINYFSIYYRSMSFLRIYGYRLVYLRFFPNCFYWGFFYFINCCLSLFHTNLAQYCLKKYILILLTTDDWSLTCIWTEEWAIFKFCYTAVLKQWLSSQRISMFMDTLFLLFQHQQKFIINRNKERNYVLKKDFLPV